MKITARGFFVGGLVLFVVLPLLRVAAGGETLFHVLFSKPKHQPKSSRHHV